MTQTPCPYDEEIRHYTYNFPIPEPVYSRSASVTYEHLLPHMTPRFNATHTYHYTRPPGSSCLPYLDEMNTLQFPHVSHSHFPVGSGPLGVSLTNYGNSSFTQPSEVCDPSGPFHLPRNLQDATYDIPLLTHHSTFDSTPYTNSYQSSQPAGDIQATPMVEFPPNYYTPTSLSHDSVSFQPRLDNTLKPYTGTSDASYPCQWTKNDVVCGVTIQATRSQMNRHLHASHGFGGSDSRQTRCYWAGCKETMQQGSIARHLVTCHLRAKVTCPMCSKKLSRPDVISKHRRVCPAASARH